MTKFMLVLAASTLLASAATYTGVITDSMCRSDHKAMKMGSDPECVKACAKIDKSVRFVLYDGKNAYKLSDQQTPEKFAGQKVKITGTLFEKTGILQVDKIELAR